jgi:hypothetical protein
VPAAIFTIADSLAPALDHRNFGRRFIESSDCSDAKKVSLLEAQLDQFPKFFR